MIDTTYNQTIPSIFTPNTFPQPKLSDGSWQCGGCRTWYAPWVRECHCQQYNSYWQYPYSIISFSQGDTLVNNNYQDRVTNER